MSESQIEKIAQIAEKISAEENRRTRQTQTINNLLQERQQVLVSMCELAELEAGDIPPDTVIHNLRNFNQQLVEGRRLRLMIDREEKDRYGRTLAYVYRDDGLFVSKLFEN